MAAADEATESSVWQHYSQLVEAAEAKLPPQASDGSETPMSDNVTLPYARDMKTALQYRGFVRRFLHHLQSRAAEQARHAARPEQQHYDQFKSEI